MRNFQILGEASSKIPNEIKKEAPGIPWKEIKGMRNILIHEYFGTSSSIVWNTIKKDLPQLQNELDTLLKKYNNTSHPWRICPPGEYYVSGSHVDAYVTRSGKSVKDHLRREHCRESSNPSANILSLNEIEIINELFISKEFSGVRLKEMGFGENGARFDSKIAGWVKYWNDIFSPDTPLDPNIIKALIGSESSFNEKAGIGKKNVAKGLGQLMPLTIKALQGYRKELRDHLIEINGDAIFNPDVNISALIRWLHQKKKLAGIKLKRNATWLEAVEEYKNVLNKKLKNPKTYKTNMKQFLNLIEKK